MQNDLPGDLFSTKKEQSETVERLNKKCSEFLSSHGLVCEIGWKGLGIYRKEHCNSYPLLIHGNSEIFELMVYSFLRGFGFQQSHIKKLEREIDDMKEKIFRADLLLATIDKPKKRAM